MKTTKIKINDFKKTILKKEELHKIFGGDGGTNGTDLDLHYINGIG